MIMNWSLFKIQAGKIFKNQTMELQDLEKSHYDHIS